MHAVALRCRIGGESEGEALHLTLLGCVGPADNQAPLPVTKYRPRLALALQHYSRVSQGSGLFELFKVEQSSAWGIAGPRLPIRSDNVRQDQGSPAPNGPKRPRTMWLVAAASDTSNTRQLQLASGKACAPGTGRKRETKLLLNIGTFHGSSAASLSSLSLCQDSTASIRCLAWKIGSFFLSSSSPPAKMVRALACCRPWHLG